MNRETRMNGTLSKDGTKHKKVGIEGLSAFDIVADEVEETKRKKLQELQQLKQALRKEERRSREGAAVQEEYWEKKTLETRL